MQFFFLINTLLYNFKDKLKSNLLLNNLAIIKAYNT
jgi:hypothetical protein